MYDWPWNFCFCCISLFAFKLPLPALCSGLYPLFHALASQSSEVSVWWRSSMMWTLGRIWQPCNPLSKDFLACARHGACQVSGSSAPFLAWAASVTLCACHFQTGKNCLYSPVVLRASVSKYLWLLLNCSVLQNLFSVWASSLPWCCVHWGLCLKTSVTEVEVVEAMSNSDTSPSSSDLFVFRWSLIVNDINISSQ